jgi:hypothetical protein
VGCARSMFHNMYAVGWWGAAVDQQSQQQQQTSTAALCGMQLQGSPVWVEMVLCSTAAPQMPTHSTAAAQTVGNVREPWGEATNYLLAVQS